MFHKHIRLLEKAICCADKAGIADKQFLAFGSLLGAVRPSQRLDNDGQPYYARGKIPWDKDMDLGYLPIHPERKDAYFNYCHEAGLFAHWQYPHRRQRRREDTNEFVWFSIKHNKRRCCQWFFFEWKNYYLHSKGKGWTAERKFPHKLYPRKDDTQAIALGAPAAPFKELMKIDFEGLPVNVPVRSGELLDFWYPSWLVPRHGGASKKNIVVIINRWQTPGKWRVL